MIIYNVVLYKNFLFTVLIHLPEYINNIVEHMQNVMIANKEQKVIMLYLLNRVTRSMTI